MSSLYVFYFKLSLKKTHQIKKSTTIRNKYSFIYIEGYMAENMAIQIFMT